MPLRGRKAFAAEQKICELKKLLLRSKRNKNLKVSALNQTN